MLNSHNEPLRLRTERDQLNNLIEQRTKYLKVPSEKMEEVSRPHHIQILIVLGDVQTREAKFRQLWTRLRYYQP